MKMAATSSSSFDLHPSAFRLLRDPPASGVWNMALDEALLEAAVAGRCTLRFYQWEVPTLSLGYFQDVADRRQHVASQRSPMVRRASGGGAILHDRELTYSLAIPERHPLAVTRLRTYQVVHQSLIETLGQWGISASMFAESPADARPASVADGVGCGAIDNSSAFLCFQRRAPGDVLVGDAKIAGSAQRRAAGAILQHGSVLLARSEAAPELDGLFELTGRAISVEELIEAWIGHLAAAFDVSWQNQPLDEAVCARAKVLAAEKYGSLDWTESRRRGGAKKA